LQKLDDRTDDQFTLDEIEKISAQEANAWLIFAGAKASVAIANK
jgi:hypothetical protein